MSDLEWIAAEAPVIKVPKERRKGAEREKRERSHDQNKNPVKLRARKY